MTPNTSGKRDQNNYGGGQSKSTLTRMALTLRETAPLAESKQLFARGSGLLQPRSFQHSHIPHT
jgi:hypothetical protein